MPVSGGNPYSLKRDSAKITDCEAEPIQTPAASRSARTCFLQASGIDWGTEYARSNPMSTQWLPKGFNTITPNIVATEAEGAVAFLKMAFGAVENYRLTMSDGKLAHCELKVGDSILNIGAAMEGWPAQGLVAQIYVEDSDAVFERAVQAGAMIIMPMTDMFFGSREGRISDPFGNVWTIATLKEAVAPEEMQRRMKAEGY
jgi:PhnB protein